MLDGLLRWRPRESLIVVDRWVYLMGGGGGLVKEAWVEAGFEYGVSLRNLGVAGVRHAGVRGIFPSLLVFVSGRWTGLDVLHSAIAAYCTRSPVLAP